MGLVFNGQDFADYGVVIDSVDSWPKPERDRTVIHVPGKNGDLILDNGCWHNIDITYHCLVKDEWKSHFPDFIKWLYSTHGYAMLADDNHPGVYRMAEFAGPITPELWFTTETGIFDLTFNCQPQMYVIAGQNATVMDFTSADAGITVSNTYGMDAYPLVRVFAPGGARLNIDNWSVVIAANPYDGIEIDCDTETCFALDEFGDHVGNAGQYVTITDESGEDRGDFPFLGETVGMFINAYHSWFDADTETTTTYTGTMEFTPRWTQI